MSAPRRSGSRKRPARDFCAAIAVLAATGGLLQLLFGDSRLADSDLPVPPAEEVQDGEEPTKAKVSPIVFERPKPQIAVQVAKAPAPKPRKPVAPPLLEAATFVPGPSDFLKGQRLLEGGFPRMVATYERIGFSRYTEEAQALGGQFFLWDSESNHPVARLDPKTGEAWEGPLSSHLSRWPRDVSAHLGDAIARHRGDYGHRASHAVLLPPVRVDEAILSGLDHLLRLNGIDPASVGSFFGAYELRGDHLVYVVLSATLKNGTQREVSFAIDLVRAGI